MARCDVSLRREYFGPSARLLICFMVELGLMRVADQVIRCSCSWSDNERCNGISLPQQSVETEQQLVCFKDVAMNLVYTVLIIL